MTVEVAAGDRGVCETVFGVLGTDDEATEDEAGCCVAEEAAPLGAAPVLLADGPAASPLSRLSESATRNRPRKPDGGLMCGAKVTASASRGTGRWSRLRRIPPRGACMVCLGAAGASAASASEA